MEDFCNTSLVFTMHSVKLDIGTQTSVTTAYMKNIKNKQDFFFGRTKINWINQM